MSPQRIQRRRTKGWRMPEGAVYVGRPSKWGNPWRVDAARATQPPTNECRATAAEVVVLFRRWVIWASPLTYADDVRRELAGRDLACWCPLDQPCHADVLLELANPRTEPHVPADVDLTQALATVRAIDERGRG